MSDVTTWWWVRHAPVPGASSGRIFGQMDADCDTSNSGDFETLAKQLPKTATVVVSHLKRTHQTLKALTIYAPSLTGDIVEKDLAEQDFGDWQGCTWNEMEANNPDAYKNFWTDPLRIAPPGGESFFDQMTRVKAAISRLTDHYRGQDIVCVSHGGTIRSAIASVLDLPPEAAMAFVVDNLSLTRMSFAANDRLRPRGSAWRIDCINVPSR